MIADVLTWANRGKISFKNFLLAGNIELGKILANTLPLETNTQGILTMYLSYVLCVLLTDIAIVYLLTEGSKG